MIASIIVGLLTTPLRGPFGSSGSKRRYCSTSSIKFQPGSNSLEHTIEPTQTVNLTMRHGNADSIKECYTSFQSSFGHNNCESFAWLLKPNCPSGLNDTSQPRPAKTLYVESMEFSNINSRHKLKKSFYDLAVR